MNRRMLIMLVVCGVVFGGIFGFKWFKSRLINHIFDTMPVPAATVSATKATAESWPSRVSAVGTAQAVKGTQVTTEVDGIVDSIGFESGGSVQAGQILLTLDRKVDRAQLQALEAQAKLADIQVKRDRKLLAQKAISESQLDQSTAQAQAARADVAAQRARVDLKVIRAPFSGELGIRKVDLGDHLAPGAPIVSLQSLDPIYVNFKLPQQQLAAVHVGQSVDVSVDMDGDRWLKGHLTAIDPLIDTSTRNFAAQATFENPDHVLRPGMFVRLEIDLGSSENVIAVPQTAISFNPYGDSVWIIGKDKNGKLTAERRVVKTGRRRGDFVQIVAGLEAGDQVATSGLLKLRNGVPVKINNRIQPTAETAPKPPNG